MMTASIIATSLIPSPASPPGAAGFGGGVTALEEIKRLCIIFIFCVKIVLDSVT